MADGVRKGSSSRFLGTPVKEKMTEIVTINVIANQLSEKYLPDS